MNALIKSSLPVLPEIGMGDFFNLPEVKACQAVQRANPHGSPKHKAASDELRRIASGYVDMNGKNCALYF